MFDEESDPSALQFVKNESINFLLTEIPLFDFKNSHDSYQKHLIKIKKGIISYLNKLVHHAYIALLVSDQRYQGQYYSRHADIIHCLKETEITLQGLINIIQDSQALTAYGYPSTYVPNIINQFAIIFRK